MQEVSYIQTERITQVYVIQSKENPFHWFGILFVDSGLYMGTVVRFIMKIDESYPDCPCPKIFLEPIPYHPLVNPETGELDTKNAFPDWNSNKHRLASLLLFLKRVFKQAEDYISQIQALLNPVSLQMKDNSILHDDPTTSNENRQLDEADMNEVANLFMFFDHSLEFIRTYEMNPSEFKQLVENFKQICLQHTLNVPRIFEHDGNSLLFSDWIPEVHEPLRNCILAGKFTPDDFYASYHKETQSVTFIPGLERN